MEIFSLAQYEFSLLGLPRAIISLVGLLVPLYLYLSERRNPLYQLYLLVIVPAFFWQFSYAWMMQAKSYDVAMFWFRLGHVGSYFLPTTLYTFSVLHTRAKRQLPFIYATYAISFFMAFFVDHPLLFSHLKKYSWGFYPIHGPLHSIQVGITLLTCFGLFFNLVRDFRKSPSQNRKKFDWLLIVAFSGGYFGALEFFPGYGIDIRPLGFIAVSFWSLIIFYALLRHRMLDLESVIKETFNYAILSLLVIASYIVFMSTMQLLLVGKIDFNHLVATSFALLAIFPLADYFRKKVQHFIAKAYHRNHLTDQETLSDFIEQLKELTNSKLLLQDLVHVVKMTTGVKHAAVFLRTNDRKKYVLCESRGSEIPVLSIEAQHGVLIWLKSHASVLEYDSLVHEGAHPEILKMASALMDEIKSSLIVPMNIGGDLIGFLALGERITEIPFNLTDIKVLGSLGKNAAVAVSNALLYEEVTEKNRALVKLDREKGNFLANTSHELRTPLHGIMGIAEAMLEGVDGPLNEKLAYHIKLIHQSGKSLADLVERLLDLQKLESERIDLEVVSFQIKDVLDMVNPLIEGVLRTKPDVKFVCDFPELPMVFGDVRLVRQVLVNLLGNAAKFTHRGQVRISAWMGNGPRGERKFANDPDRFVTIAVEDSGIGIRAEDRDVIFERFRQADNSVKRQYGGTGLGLAIVQKIVELHQGRIWVDSEPGRGSTFFFSLPQFSFEAQRANVSVAPQASDEQQIVSAHDSALSFHPMTQDRLYQVPKIKDLPVHHKGHGEKIVVVDDNLVNLEVVRSALESQGYRVGVFSDAETAWLDLQRHGADMVILDVMMPKVSGYDLCLNIRQHETLRRTPIIMVTAKSSLEDKVYGLNVGADEYITKPFNQEELLARVNTFIRIKRMQDEIEQMYREIKTISEVSSVINHELELDRLLVSILDKVFDLVNAERGAIFTKDDSTNHFSLRFSKGFTSQKRTSVFQKISSTVVQRTLTEGESFIEEDLSKENLDFVEMSGSLVCLPLTENQEIFGALYLYSSRPQALHRGLLRILLPLTQQLSSSIRKAKLYDQAVTDDLTRLYHKRYFIECLRAEKERSYRERVNFSVLMVDVDHFKKFNDTHGHQVGDSVLVQVAELLQDSCRISDVAARYGGEEFIILLRNTDLHEAEVFAQRYRQLVENFRLHHRGQQLKVTLSVGVCTFEPSEGLTAEDIIGSVDLELYKAKNAGRNCVVSKKVAAPEFEKEADFPQSLI